MRRKINYQTPEYVMNNELICFGLSSHDSEEWKMSWTPQAEKDLAIVRMNLEFYNWEKSVETYINSFYS
jgi:hypothetical protein